MNRKSNIPYSSNPALPLLDDIWIFSTFPKAESQQGMAIRGQASEHSLVTTEQQEKAIARVSPVVFYRYSEC